MQPFAIRQGDVMLRPETIPTNAKKITLRPLALGEKTGHHHSLLEDPGVTMADQVQMYEKDGEVYVSVKGDGVSLVHQEHKAHPHIVPGDYKVVIQQENTDWGSRAVLD